MLPILDYVSCRFEVIRHVRPAFSCRSCESMVQAPMPSLPIKRGQPGRACSPTCWCRNTATTCRQSGIYARDGVELDRATLADWVGKMAALLEPLVGAVERHVLAADRLHADERLGSNHSVRSSLPTGRVVIKPAFGYLAAQFPWALGIR